MLNSGERRDITKSVLTYIKNSVDLPSDLSLGESTATGQSVSFLLGPGQLGTRYMDGQRKKHYSFTVAVKLTDSLKAEQLLNDIMDVMEISGTARLRSLDGSFYFVESHMTNNPTYRTIVTDGGVNYAVYTGQFSMTVII